MFLVFIVTVLAIPVPKSHLSPSFPSEGESCFSSLHLFNIYLTSWINILRYLLVGYENLGKGVSTHVQTHACWLGPLFMAPRLVCDS